MNMKITRTPIIAKSRKLNSKYTLQASQDLKVMMGADIEKHLMDALMREMRLQYMEMLV